MKRLIARRSARSDRGAALLELALVLVPLLLLAFGTAEMGVAWVAQNRVEGATSTAARIGSAAGAQPDADVRILVALRSALPEKALAELDRVVVFKPSGSSGQVPSGCIKDVGSSSQAGVPGSCNTYTGATVRGITPTSDLGDAGTYWHPTDREDSLAGPPDDIGVWVRTKHEDITGTFWSDFMITRQSIYRIQPDIDG